MAKLKTTSVTGDLSISGKITNAEYNNVVGNKLPDLQGQVNDIANNKLPAITGQLDSTIQQTNTKLSEFEVKKANNTEIARLDNTLLSKASKDDVARISSGTPLFASNTSGMTDTTKNYVNTTDGYLYIYSGGSWTKTSVKYQEVGISDGQVTPIKTNFFSSGYVGKNRFNQTDTNNVTGKYMNNLGQIFDNATYGYTHKIKVKEGEVLTASYQNSSFNVINSSFRFVTAFDENGNVLSAKGASVGTSTYTVPNGVDSVIFTCDKGLFVNKKAMIENSATITSYESYKGYADVVKNENLKTKLKVFLPSEFCVAVGTVIEIYNNQIVLNSHRYNINWTCSVGQYVKRKFRVVGESSKIGNYTLTLNIYDDDLNLIYTKDTTVKIVPLITNTMSVCPIGDSLSNNKRWLYEVPMRTNRKISYVGKIPYTIGTTNVVTGGHEGRSGFKPSDYLKATPYNGASFGGINESVHAFWNPTNTRFDWNYYKSTVGVNPNAVQIFLGTNGIAFDNSQNVADIKQIIDYIRQDDANIPIFIVYTLFKGDQNGIGYQGAVDGYSANSGQFKYGEDCKIIDLLIKLNDVLGDKYKTYFIPVAQTHDSENNFTTANKYINSATSKQETVQIESVHPNEEGYIQFADIILSTYSAYL